MEGWFVELCDRFTYSPYANRQILFSLFCRDVYLSDDFLGSAEAHQVFEAAVDPPLQAGEGPDHDDAGAQTCIRWRWG